MVRQSAVLADARSTPRAKANANNTGCAAINSAASKEMLIAKRIPFRMKSAYAWQGLRHNCLGATAREIIPFYRALRD
jgi:hypothetical protein